MAEAYELSALEARQKIKEGTLTSERLMQSCLERINLRSDEVEAWTFIDPELALHLILKSNIEYDISAIIIFG